MTTTAQSFYFLTDDDFMKRVKWLMGFFQRISTSTYSDIELPLYGEKKDARVGIAKRDRIESIRSRVCGLDAGELLETMVTKESKHEDFKYKEWIEKRISSHKLSDFVQDNVDFSYDKNKYDFIKAAYNCLTIYEESIFRVFNPSNI